MEKKRFKKIYIEITNICNLKCSFCPEGRRKKEFIDINKFEYIINQIKNFTNLVTLHVKGEPLLHPKLKEILEICEKNNILVNITTNATLLEKNLDILINNSSIRQINLSLHSIIKNENSDKYDFSEYIESTIKASKVILEKTDIIISYRLWNLEKIEQNDKNWGILKKLEQSFNIKGLAQIAKEEKFVKLDKNAYLNQDLEFIWPSLQNPIISECGTCWGLRNQVAILVNGDVVPCCLDENGEIKLGNIFKENFDDIINSKISKDIIKGFEENKITQELCKRCGYREKFYKKEEKMKCH